jgi:hypothetical protein
MRSPASAASRSPAVTTEWLMRCARAYAARRYEGDLVDILSLAQIKGPKAALGRLAAALGPEERTLASAFEAMGRITINNQAFPQGFLRRIAETDCEHRSCRECGYCASVAERVLKIDGRPPSIYQPPRGLPSPTGLLSILGPE